MFEKMVSAYKQLPFGLDLVSLAIYPVVFSILLKIKHVSPLKNWFVQLFAVYFGIVFATLFFIFLNTIMVVL